MTKKNDMSNLKNIGMGILDTLSGIKEDNKPTEEEKSNSVDTQNDKEVLDQNSESANKSKVVNTQSNKNVNDKSNKSAKETKNKRSFMLTDTTIQRLNLLKLCMSDKDLSTIVEESVGLYFNKNKKSIESLIDIYEKVK